MNLQSIDVPRVASALLAMLVQITALLLIAIVAARWIARTPATRHAVLFYSMLAVGLIPPLMALSSLRSVGPALTAPWQLVPQPMASVVTDTFTIHTAATPSSPHEFPPVVFLLGIWAGGAMVMFIRLGIGLQTVERIRRGAIPIDRGAEVGRVFGSRTPKVLASSELSTPVALGVFRRVVILPLSLAQRLDEDQRLQVLIHECAHAVRRDPLMGLYQRALAAAFWFHPLVHSANRMLDTARQDVCDNYALRSAAPTDYAETLLKIGQAVGFAPDELLAPTLIGSACELESRIAGLLSKRRCIMTQLNGWKLLAIIQSVAIVALVLWVVCLGMWNESTRPAAALPAGAAGVAVPAQVSAAASLEEASRQDTEQRADDFDKRHPPLPIPATFPKLVSFEMGQSDLAAGDNITITEIHGTADTIKTGEVYQITGTCILTSHDQARISAYVSSKYPIDGVSHTQISQTTWVKRGQNNFILILPMRCEGYPHVSFYADGHNIGGVYFGTGDSVLR